MTHRPESVAAERERESEPRLEALALQIRRTGPAGQGARPAGGRS